MPTYEKTQQPVAASPQDNQPNTVTGGGQMDIANQNNAQPRVAPGPQGSPANMMSDQGQNWLNSDAANNAGNRVRNDAYQGFTTPTDRWGQDVRNGNTTVMPDGTVNLYDGFQNSVGMFDSAGNFHGNMTDAELARTWEEAARAQLEANGHKFTGDGSEWDRIYAPGAGNGSDNMTAADWNGRRGQGYGPWTRPQQSWEEALRSYLGPDTTPVYQDQLIGNPMALQPGQSYINYGDAIGRYTANDFSGLPSGAGGGANAWAGMIRNSGGGGYEGGYGNRPGGLPTGGNLDPTVNLPGRPGGLPTGGDLDPAQILPGLDIGRPGGLPTGGDLDPTVNLPGGGGGTGNPNAPGGVTGGAAGYGYPQTPDLKPYLDEWRNAAEEQRRLQIDDAVRQGTEELMRAQEDAQKGFQNAQEQISAEEAANKDNQALYAEARGDKGGIGAAQYDSIMNTAAQNRQQVRDQQTQLATDTSRQIADLRAKGEFEKADALLDISQSYLSNLMQLEQWAATYGLNAAQFAESIRQWEENYKLSVAEMMGEYNGQQTMAAKNADRNYGLNLMQFLEGQRQFDKNFGLNEAGVTGYYNGRRTLAGENADRNFNLSEAGITGYYNGSPTWQREQNQMSTMASIGQALLNAGIMPSADQLRALGLDESQAQSLLMAAQAKSSGGYTGTPITPPEQPEAPVTPPTKPTQKLDNNAFNMAASGILSNAKDGKHSETDIVNSVQAIEPYMTDAQFEQLQIQLGKLGIEISR